MGYQHFASRAEALKAYDDLDRWPGDTATDAEMSAWANRCLSGFKYVLDCLDDGRAERRAGLIYFVRPDHSPTVSAEDGEGR